MSIKKPLEGTRWEVSQITALHEVARSEDPLFVFEVVCRGNDAEDCHSAGFHSRQKNTAETQRWTVLGLLELMGATIDG